MHFRKHLSVILCGHTRGLSGDSPEEPRHQPRRAPHLEQLLRVGHGDLHFHLLHNGPRVQLPATRAAEVRAEAAVHGCSVNRAAVARADRTHRKSSRGTTGNRGSVDSHKAAHAVTSLTKLRPESPWKQLELHLPQTSARRAL